MKPVEAGMENSNKRKNYYPRGRGRGGYGSSRGGYGSNNWNNKKFKSYLKPGLTGFLCTCNMREKDCIRESLNVLNEYVDKLGLRQSNEVISDKPKSEDNVQHEEIEDELQKEVSSLKTVDNKRELFSVADTGVPNNIFINSMVEDPVTLAYAILNDVASTKVSKGRFLLRIVPVEATCKANLEDIKTAAGPLFDKHFQCEPTTFAVNINKRYNSNILRDELIHALALLVTDRNRDHKADLKQAKKTVLLEIVKGLCCISVLEDYKRLRHYNQAELSKPEGEGEGVDAKPEEGLVEGGDSQPDGEEVGEGEENGGTQEDEKRGDADKEGKPDSEKKEGGNAEREGKPDEDREDGEPPMDP